MKVCLVTPGQPSSNPRLVKEADALVDAGYDVHVVASYFADWATDADRALRAARRWTMTFVDWRRSNAPALFHYSRLRHFAARTVADRIPQSLRLGIAALSRVGPELRQATGAVDADLYIAHNLAALPIVGAVAARKSALAAFDAEDFHPGQRAAGTASGPAALVEAVERRWLAKCAYVTAAAPAIAEAYRERYRIALPATILNVFPLRDRPATRRPLDPTTPLRLYWFSQTIGADRGLEHVVAAMSELRAFPIELHLRGSWQPDYERTLRSLAASHGLAQQIVHNEPAAPDEMVRLAADYDIGLAVEPGTTLNNDLAISNKIFTYLLAGNAVIATRTRGQASLISALGPAASWCDGQSPQSLAAALRPWLVDRAALEGARAEAWRQAETRFNWDLERSRYLDIVRAALGEKSAAPARASQADTEASRPVAPYA